MADLLCARCLAPSSEAELLDEVCATCRCQSSLEEIEMGMLPVDDIHRKAWSRTAIREVVAAIGRGERMAEIAIRMGRSYNAIRAVWERDKRQRRTTCT